MASKNPGLYLCGEILNVDGRIGGFNFNGLGAQDESREWTPSERTIKPHLNSPQRQEVFVNSQSPLNTHQHAGFMEKTPKPSGGFGKLRGASGRPRFPRA